LPYDRKDSQLVAHLNGLDAQRLLIVFFNWRSRLIKAQPRQVRKSKAFERNPNVTRRKADLNQIIDDIEKGRDLQRYLSRSTMRDVAGVPSKRRRPDLDLMLNDWSVHHLHISTKLDPDGFVKRGAELLFAVFQPNVAYIVDLMEHGDWTRDHVLEVLASEWPNEGVIFEAKGIGATSITEAQRANLRANHYNVQFQFDGRALMPAGFMMAAGNTFGVTRYAHSLLVKIADFEQSFASDPTRLSADFEKHGLALPDPPEFEFAIIADEAGILETKSRAWMKLIPQHA
jgi:hypothetical protein